MATLDLDAESRNYLLSEARSSISSHFVRGGRSRDARKPPEGSQAACGAFVTLKERGELRGCIGRMQSPRPLYETIVEMARAAAFEDPRFEPLDEAELPSVDIEITVLSPLVALDDPSELVIGRHGLYLVSGARAGVLLPQVAIEYGWNREEFLAHTCRKAGLPPDAWKWPDSRLFLFEGLVFGETRSDESRGNQTE